MLWNSNQVTKIVLTSLGESQQKVESSFISGFCHEFVDFFHRVPTEIEAQSDTKVSLSPLALRKELFKCHYDDDLFNVAEQADASECFQKICEKIHTFVSD